MPGLFQSVKISSTIDLRERDRIMSEFNNDQTKKEKKKGRSIPVHAVFLLMI